MINYFIIISIVARYVDSILEINESLRLYLCANSELIRTFFHSLIKFYKDLEVVIVSYFFHKAVYCRKVISIKVIFNVLILCFNYLISKPNLERKWFIDVNSYQTNV